MNNKNIADKVNEIGKIAFSKLNELSIPAYPKYYHNTFMDTLFGSEDSSLIDLTKNHPYLFSTEAPNEEKELNLSLAKASIEEFEKSNENLKTISDENIIDISSIKKDYEQVNATKVLKVFDSFQERIISELKNADETITRLKVEIERLERESHIDPLTKAYNRRVFVKDLEEILQSGMDKELDLYLVIFDADDFKDINDSYGHIAGDKTLIFLSKLLQNSLHKNTKIYRYGGEEFIILLQKVELEDIEKTVDRIITETDESKLLYKGHNIHLTLSAGIAKHQKNDKVDDLLERADKALYSAKNSGKNCFKVNI